MQEGEASVLVPEKHNVTGPGKKGGVFYNRQMAFNRDVCVSVLQSNGRLRTALDAMCASGVRSVRIEKEVPSIERITACDISRKSTLLAGMNARRNNCSKIEIVEGNALACMGESSFDYIDIDPFGTPVRFILPALISVRRGGIIGITATDTAVLCGSAPGCERRYLSKARRWPFMHELGVRILAGFVVRMAASIDRAAIPLLCISVDHYFRLYFRVENGASLAERMLRENAFAYYDHKTLERGLTAGDTGTVAGPMWGGRLHEPSLLKEMRQPPACTNAKRFKKYLELWRAEAEAPPLYYTLDELSHLLHGYQPKMNELLASLEGSTRTHFEPKGFKCGLRLSDICDIVMQHSLG
ncbi:MAG: methyltransferase [Methanomassiliicoccales archaeon]